MVVAVFVLGALAVWFLAPSDFLKQVRAPLSNASIITESSSAPFTISPPSIGPAYRSTDLMPIAALSGANAVVFIQTPDAAAIKEGQLVLLYDAQDQLLDLVGRVTSLKQGTGSMTATYAVHIAIEERATIPTRLAMKAEIVIAGISNALRLPDSAIMTNVNKSNEAFVWEAIKDTDQTAVLKQNPVKSFAAMDHGYSVVQIDSYTSNLYVLFPKAHFKDGMTIPIREILYTPHAPDANAHAQSIKYDRIFDSMAVAAGNDNEADGDTTPPVSGGESCPQSCGEGQTVTDFIETIRAMGNKQAQP